VERIVLISKNPSGETLHARYAELLRLREYVQRLERDAAESKERQAVALGDVRIADWPA
jgi:hypothetical protein